MGSLKHFYVVFSIPFVFAALDEGLSRINGDVKRLDNEKFSSFVAGTWVERTYKGNDPFPVGENLNRTRRDVGPDDASDQIAIKTGGRSQQKPVSSVFPRKCGIINVSPDDGGSTIEKTPWLVAVAYSGYKIIRCIGVIISKKYVLTSGHCADASIGSSREAASYVIAGRPFMQERGREYNITRVTIHPDYNYSPRLNDIALFEISGKFTFSNDIQPICMPYHELYKINRQGVFTGWLMEERGHSHVTNILSKAECIKKHNGLLDIVNVSHAGMFCTTYSNRNGFAGGPFLVNEGVRHYLLGLYSAQFLGLPHAYTKVISYMGWIKDVMTGVKSEYNN